jgi:hypothetical protein
VLGTFLSLVGSSFLATMREHEGTLDESHNLLEPPESVPLAPTWTQRKAG